MRATIENKLRKAGYLTIAGVDEAGRGPLAGPVVSAAVILAPGTKLPGLNDSKKLTEKARDRLFKLIIDQALDFSITFIPPAIIDQINILQATLHANQLCIQNLTIQPDIILLDGRDKQEFPIPHQMIVKGDTKVRSIAAASILAKVTRDHLMTHYSDHYPAYNFRQHKGYGTYFHRQAIAEHGPSELHRESFLKNILS